MINVQKLRDALALTAQIDALFTDSGIYESEEGYTSAFNLRDFIEDLEMDIARIEESED